MAAPQSAAQRRILIATQDPNWAAPLISQLKSFGYRVDWHDDVAGIETGLKDQRAALVIADGDWDGRELNGIEYFKSLSPPEGIRPSLFFVSQRSDIVARLAAVRAGGAAFFGKPVDLSALVDQINRVMEDEDSEPYRVLIVDDAAELAEHYAATLADANMATRIVTEPLEVMSPLLEFQPDLVLMDLHMPHADGLELARVIRQQDTYVGVPIVFMSSRASAQRQKHAMLLGGDGFLVKPIGADDLISAVVARADRLRTIRRFMIRDGLTGLLNHNAVKERVVEQQLLARRRESALSFALLDLDNFKKINDTYGHATGDRVLRSLGHLLRSRLRRSDLVGRFGGEEFAVILPDTPLADAGKVMADVRALFAGLTHVAADGQESIHVTLSCGIAGQPPLPPNADLPWAADQALYEAKYKGRNQVVLASDPA